ncbi:haloacid dehalogenase superfamily, subfamily IA, variant 3 with third motif having DD or ED [Streptoalloteichus tenebrarius]|uniref:Haloacid dehalogenase superfamily, subfamily IA, variant 3 with third motif having DD or ED n=1 Tax=Streptoalloteichus tenebrarius (strain ATCC 17920 / DSM 40477 / JCM 4838 / CBS 697.72 / NBRC 16177 / NCIMB 11028 / NRRL B-12390 / A12253. 1 / ISP 5477) TaxID=1933 RepID=A0ABT1HP53_STRSD|nr:haloacid dehalogenase superfamily, subfamily IA, variant 3 with third motif having DD or ED [Streptoalloteichus tenebrarius]
MPGLSTSDGRRPPAAVLWDMDGTLVDSEKLWDVPLFELAERLGGTLSQATRDAMVGSNMTATLAMLFAEVGREPDQEAMAEAAEWITSRTAELFRAGLPWRPGAFEALRAVRSSGVPMALVTSTERRLTEVALDTIGREFFDVTVCGDEVDGRNKPLPEPYLKAARLLGVSPVDCVAVEDSPTGTAAAVAAGCTVLVVPCEVPVEPGERRVLRDSLVGVDLDELAALLS